MDDKTLADKCVALGVGSKSGDRYSFVGPSNPAQIFVRDARVAMALMERCDALHYWKLSNWRVDARTGHSNLTGAQGDSLPRAIIEAAVKALEGS